MNTLFTIGTVFGLIMLGAVLVTDKEGAAITYPEPKKEMTGDCFNGVFYYRFRQTHGYHSYVPAYNRDGSIVLCEEL